MSSSPSDSERGGSGGAAAADAGLVEVTMPQMGISVAEGTIVEWRKRPGDWVEADETVCVATTDKVDVEIPAPASGRIARLLAELDETVEVGQSIAEIDTAGRPGEPHPDEHNGRGEGGAEAPAARGEEGAQAPPRREPAGDGEVPDRSGFYSPVVRRIAERHDVDLSRVEGTGIGGRVRKRDVLAHIESGSAAEAPSAEPEAPREAATLHTESPYRPEEEEAPAREPARPESAPAAPARPEPAPAGDGAARPPAAPPDEAVSGPVSREPMSPMRKRIAEHMVTSRRTSAHCTTITEADFSRVAARRAELREAMKRRGVNLTYLAFVAQATVEALQEHPILNASIEGDEIVHHEDVNLGIAVAVDEGLIVPVIRQAQRLSLEGLAAAIGDLAKRARSGELAPDEVHGGTFTITNPGQFGSVLATPIINQPQVAILDLEAVVKRPVVVEEEGGDAIAIRPMSYLCMSWDHRALDGVQAARFLADIRRGLETLGEGG